LIKREKCKLQELEQAKLAKYRDNLAKERIKERSKLLQRSLALNRKYLTKYTLLSKPAAEFIGKSRLPSYTIAISVGESSNTVCNEQSNSQLSYATSETCETTPSQNETLLKYSSLLKNSAKHGSKGTCLRKLFPLNQTKNHYAYLNILENVADIFTYVTLSRNMKVMNQAAFRFLIK
jgi:hypothetical protein